MADQSTPSRRNIARAEAKVLIENCRKRYNQFRPHSSLNYLTPNEFINQVPQPASQTAML